MKIRDLFLPVFALKHTIQIVLCLIRKEPESAVAVFGCNEGSNQSIKPSVVQPYFLLLLMSSHLATAMAANACDDSQTYFDIPSQAMNDALLRFGADAKLTMLFPFGVVRELRSTHIHGCMSAQQALSKLLSGSGLGYRFVDEHTVTLEHMTVTSTETEKQVPTLLAPIEVYTTGIRGNTASPPPPEDETESNINRYSQTTVTSATRTPTPIKNLPQSIQVAGQNLLKDQQNVTVSENLMNFSSVVSRSTLFTPVVEGTVIRGMRSEQMIDGFSQYYNAGDRESTVNIEQIVVLKGANALLYSGGAGATPGGLIDIVSKTPKAEAFAEAGFKVGSDEFYQPYFDWNQPINASAAVRVTGEYTRSGSHINIIDTERFNINPSLSLASADQNTQLLLHGKFSRWQQPEYQGLPATGTITGRFRLRTDMFIGPADMPDSHSDGHAVWARLAHTFNSTWSINLRGRYAASDYVEKAQTLVNNTGTIADTPLIAPSTWALTNGELYQNQQEFSFSGEVLARFNLGASQNTLLFGGDRSILDDGGYQDVGRILGLVDLSEPDFKYPYRSPGPAVEEYALKNLTYGGYLQWQSDVFSRVHTLFGLRLGGVEIDSLYSVAPESIRTETLKLLPRIGAVVDVTDGISFFASFNQGMRGQPYIAFSEPPTPAISVQLEGGIKLAFDDRISGQLALYRIDRSEVAVLNPNNISFSSGGKQRSQGIETDLTWHPLDGLDVLASYAYTDARFVESLDRFPKNSHLAWIPEHSGRLWANYRFQNDELKGWSLGFGVYARSGAFLANNNQFSTAGYHIFDAALAYETPQFRLAATAKNLSDEDYFQPYQYFGNGASGGGRVVPGSGPAVFFSVSVRY